MKKHRITQGAILVMLLSLVGCDNKESSAVRRAEDMVNGSNYALGKDHANNVLGVSVDGLKDDVQYPTGGLFDGGEYGLDNVSVTLVPTEMSTTINSSVDFQVNVTTKEENAEGKMEDVIPDKARVVITLKSASGAVGALSVLDKSILVNDKDKQSTSQQLVLDVVKGHATIRLTVGNAFSDKSYVYAVNAWTQSSPAPYVAHVHVVSNQCTAGTCKEGNDDTENNIEVPEDIVNEDPNNQVSPDIGKLQALESDTQNMFTNTSTTLRVKLVSCNADTNDKCKGEANKKVCYTFIRGNNSGKSAATVINDSNGVAPKTDTKINVQQACGTTDSNGIYSVTLNSGGFYDAKYYLNFYHGSLAPVSYTVKTQKAPEDVGDGGSIAIPTDDSGNHPETLHVESSECTSTDWGKVLAKEEMYKDCYVNNEFKCCVLENTDGTFTVCKDPTLCENGDCGCSTRDEYGHCTDSNAGKCETPVTTDEGSEAHVVLEEDENGEDYYVGTDTDGDAQPDVAPDPCKWMVCSPEPTYKILCSTDIKGAEAHPCPKYEDKINNDMSIYIKVVDARTGLVAQENREVNVKLDRGYYASNNAVLKDTMSLTDSGKTDANGIVAGGKKFTISTGTGYDAFYLLRVTSDGANPVNIPISVLNNLPMSGNQGGGLTDPETGEDVDPVIDPETGEVTEPEITPPPEMPEDDPAVADPVQLVYYPEDVDREPTVPIVKTLNLRVKAIKKKANEDDPDQPIGNTTIYWKVTRGDSIANNATLTANSSKTDDNGIALVQFYTGTGYDSTYVVSAFHPDYENEDGDPINLSYVVTTENNAGGEPDPDPHEQTPDVITPTDPDTGNPCCTLQRDSYDNIKHPYMCVECDVPDGERTCSKTVDGEKKDYTLCARNPGEPGGGTETDPEDPEVGDFTQKDDDGNPCCTKKKDRYNNIITPVQCMECDLKGGTTCVGKVKDGDTEVEVKFGACADITTIQDTDPSVGHEDVTGPNGHVCCPKKRDDYGNIVLVPIDVNHPEKGLKLECDCKDRNEEDGTCKNEDGTVIYDICEYAIEKDANGNICCTPEGAGCKECDDHAASCKQGNNNYVLCSHVTDENGNLCCDRKLDDHGNPVQPIACANGYVCEPEDAEPKDRTCKKNGADEPVYSMCIGYNTVPQPSVVTDADGNLCCEKKRDKHGNLIYPPTCLENYKCEKSTVDPEKMECKKDGQDSPIYSLCAELAELPITQEDEENLENEGSENSTDDEGNPCCTKTKDAYGNLVHPIECEECSGEGSYYSTDRKTCYDGEKTYGVCGWIITPQDQDVNPVDTDADGHKCCKKNRDAYGNVVVPVSCSNDGCVTQADGKTCKKDGDDTVYGLCANMNTAEDDVFEGTTSTDPDGNPCCSKVLDSHGNPLVPVQCKEDCTMSDDQKTCVKDDGTVLATCSGLVTPQEMQELIEQCKDSDDPKCYHLVISSSNPVTTTVNKTIKVKARLIRLGLNKPVKDHVIGWSRDTRPGADGEIRGTSVTVMDTELTGGFTNANGEQAIDFFTGSKDATYKLKATTVILNKSNILKSKLVSAIATVNVLPHSTTVVPKNAKGLIYLTATDSSDSTDIYYRVASAEYYECTPELAYKDVQCGALAKHRASQSYEQGCSKDWKTGKEVVAASAASDEANARRIVAKDVTDSFMIYAVGKDGTGKTGYACIDSSQFENYVCHNTEGTACSFDLYNRSNCHKQGKGEKVKTYFCKKDGGCKYSDSCVEKTGDKDVDDKTKEDLGGSEAVCEVKDCSMLVIDKNMDVQPLPPTIAVKDYNIRMKVDIGPVFGNLKEMKCENGDASIGCILKQVTESYNGFSTKKNGGDTVDMYLANYIVDKLITESSCFSTVSECKEKDINSFGNAAFKDEESCSGGMTWTNYNKGCECGKVYRFAFGCKTPHCKPNCGDSEGKEDKAKDDAAIKAKKEEIAAQIRSYINNKLSEDYCKLLNGIQYVTLTGTTKIVESYTGKTKFANIVVEFANELAELGAVGYWDKGSFDVENRELSISNYVVPLTGTYAYGQYIYDAFKELIPEEIREKEDTVSIFNMLDCTKVFPDGLNLGDAVIPASDVKKLCTSGLNSFTSDKINIAPVKQAALQMKFDSKMVFSVPRGAKCEGLFGAARCYRQFNQSDLTGTATLNGKTANVKGKWVGSTEKDKSVTLNTKKLCKQ